MGELRIYEIGTNFWVIKSEEKDFHRNIYFKRFEGANGKAVNMIMDPGTKKDLPNIMLVSKKLFGGIQNLHLIFLSHQDPDLTSIVPALMATAPKTKVIASIDTWRLLKMYGGIPEKRFLAVEGFKGDILNIKSTGHQIRFVNATYCHFRGAMMFYDLESKILFTGDFMGGVDSRDGEGVYATEDSWDGIALFHEIYMPSSKAVKETINRITLLEPFPEVIAPQHGDVIKGGLLLDFLSRLYNLEVGIELLAKDTPEKDLTIMAINDFLDKMKEHFSSFHDRLVERLRKVEDFTPSFIFKGDSISDLKLSTTDAIKTIWKMIDALTEDENVNEIRTFFISSLDQFNVEPPFEVETSENVETLLERTGDLEGDIEDLIEGINNSNNS